MIYTIRDHILDLLQADSTLYASGTAWGTAWTGVKRVSSSTSPVANYVNLYDSAYEIGMERPAIYLGSPRVPYIDRENRATVAGTYQQDRILRQELCLVTSSTKRQDAERQNLQLLNNVKKILFTKPIESGYWYSLRIRDNTQPRTSGQGSGTTGIYEAITFLPLEILYTWTPNSAA